jgi:hypothetical protein
VGERRPAEVLTASLIHVNWHFASKIAGVLESQSSASPASAFRDLAARLRWELVTEMRDGDGDAQGTACHELISCTTDEAARPNDSQGIVG